MTWAIAIARDLPVRGPQFPLEGLMPSKTFKLAPGGQMRGAINVGGGHGAQTCQSDLTLDLSHGAKAVRWTPAGRPLLEVTRAAFRAAAGK